MALLWFISEETKLVPRRLLVAFGAWTLLGCLSQVLDLGDLTWIESRPIVLRVDLPFGLDFLYQEVERGPILFVLASVGFLLHLYLLGVVIAFRRSGKKRESLLLFASLGFILLAQVIDVLIGTGLVEFVFLLEYAWLATILVVGLNRSNDFIEAALTRQALERSDQELQESRATLSTIVDSTEDLVWSVDADSFRLLAFNRSFRERLAESRDIAVAAGMGPEELFRCEGEAARWREIYGRARKSGGYVDEIAADDGSRIYALRINPLQRRDAVFGLAVFAEDITGRKRAEELVRRSLAEKEVLLREIHHRTKNNMSVIISMLRLQANEVGDARLKEAFALSIDRIMSMSLVHDRLYKTGDLSLVDLAGYLEELAQRLIASYARPDSRPSLVLEAESLAVTLETATSCGLIVNELVTNALKHAFPAGRKGEIRLRLERLPEGLIRLTVSDDGPGPGPDFDTRRDAHLGLRLVRSLAERKLRAELRFGAEGGFSCSLDFAERKAEELPA